MGLSDADEDADAEQVVHRLYVQGLGPEASIIGPPEHLR